MIRLDPKLEQAIVSAVSPEAIGRDKRAYTVHEAAIYIGRSDSFLRQLKRDNKIVARRDGKLLIFFREDLDDYLDSLKVD
ncbi:excisionase family DNA-binding protein [Microbacterium immunditiarum]|uniref:Excisionase family DNA binding protein n=1 Tax=Microbacterium immunditiarum TaxID=337480 RepID=A0A7Y9KJ55_9MICO|nr:excisionase family DNA-binding protein [Microbacterium immunditiarum]NYE19450.1 excisionase family DNA binding protein [Microbacterium immunditiarum]